MKNKTYNRKKIMVVFLCAVLLITALFGRLVYLMIFDAAHYQKLAKDLHERERKIKAARGEIVDRNGVVLATNRTVCTISVIHNQMKDPEQVIAALCQELGEEEEKLIKRIFAKKRLTARGYSKILKTARTIADIDGNVNITTANISEAFYYRGIPEVTIH